MEILSFSSGPDDFLVYVPLDPIVLLATPNATGEEAPAGSEWSWG